MSMTTVQPQDLQSKRRPAGIDAGGTPLMRPNEGSRAALMGMGAKK